MKKYPHTKQEGIKDCGASCLSMIIRYYNGYYNLEDLRELTKTTKNGTTAYHLIEASKKIGFNSKGIKISLNEFETNNIVLPAIAHVTIDKSYNHFVVIYEINYKKKYLIIGDPKDKIKKVSFSEFQVIFNNILIVLYPFKKIQINTQPVTHFKFIKNIIKQNKSLLKKLFILSFFVTIFSIISSFYVEYMFNGLYNNNSKKYLFIIFIFFFSIELLRLIGDFLRNKIIIYINKKVDLNITIDTFKKIILLPYHYYRNRTTGEMLSRINDLDTVRDIISKVALSMFIDLPLTLISIVFLIRINKTLFLISSSLLICYLIILFIFKPIFLKYINKIQEEKANYTSFMTESISGFETVKGIHKENFINKLFEGKYNNYLNILNKFQNSYFLEHAIKEAINNLGFIIITFIGCMLVKSGSMKLGSLLTFNALVLYFLDPIRNIIDLDYNIKEAKCALLRVLELDIKYENIGKIDKQIKGNILIKDLYFSFNDRDNVLNNINLEIKSGSKTVVLGKSGSGKSTLFKLLMKYHKVEKNKVFIDNIDINDCKESLINNNILYLGQNEMLFTDTIYNNVVLDNEIDNNKLIHMSNICELNEIINNNLGFNTLIEENGFNLSGGEKQRIILLRTILNPFNVLIIDERLNQVDINLERRILKKLFQEFKNKTIIVISHRLDNLDLFDNMIEMKKGKIVRRLNKSN